MKDDEKKSGDEEPVPSVAVTKHVYATPSISVIGNVVELLAGESGNYPDGTGGFSDQPP
jgi:hypothetical protein